MQTVMVTVGMEMEWRVRNLLSGNGGFQETLILNGSEGGDG
jgi:hypothetical protein